MILALEYYIRTGIIKNMAHFPCSLFLTHCINLDNYKIVTIKNLEKEYHVQHWDFIKFRKNFSPILKDFNVEKHKIYTHESIVVPEYNILNFSITNYKFNDDAHFEEKEYESYLDNFLCPIENKKARKKWLWDVFLKSHKIKTFIYKPFNLQVKSIFLKYPNLEYKWKKWIYKFYLNDYSVASEILFMKEYQEKKDIESKNIDKIYKNEYNLITNNK